MISESCVVCRRIFPVEGLHLLLEVLHVAALELVEFEQEPQRLNTNLEGHQRGVALGEVLDEGVDHLVDDHLVAHTPLHGGDAIQAVAHIAQTEFLERPSAAFALFVEARPVLVAAVFRQFIQRVHQRLVIALDRGAVVHLLQVVDPLLCHQDHPRGLGIHRSILHVVLLITAVSLQ